MQNLEENGGKKNQAPAQKYSNEMRSRSKNDLTAACHFSTS